MSKTKIISPVVHKPFTKNFNTFVKFLFDWMEGSTNAREMIYEVARGQSSYSYLVSMYDPLDYDDNKQFGEMWATLRYFKSSHTKKACKAAVEKYIRINGD